MDDATTATGAFFGRGVRTGGCGQSTLDWPRRRHRSCHRRNQLGGQEKSVMNDSAFAARASRRRAVLQQLGVERG
jgi:hypothetical protein